MPENKIDLTWVREQLHRAGYTGGEDGSARQQSIATSVELLVRRLNDMTLAADDRHEVVQVFTRLASGSPIAPANVTGTAVWVDLVSIGSHVEIGDTVRVHPDAFDGDGGDDLNGAVGRLVGVRGGIYTVDLPSTSDTTGAGLDKTQVQVLQRTTR